MIKEKNIIFDLYGTLVYMQRDSGILKEYAKAAGMTKLRAKSEFMRKPINDTELVKSVITEVVDYSKVYDDVRPILQLLKYKYNKKLFLLSNLAQPYQAAVYIHKLDSYFDKIYFSFKTGYLKPEKKAFQQIIDENNLDYKDTIMIGDKYEDDCAGAIETGINFLWLKRNLKSTVSDVVITSLSDLEKK